MAARAPHPWVRGIARKCTALIVSACQESAVGRSPVLPCSVRRTLPGTEGRNSAPVHDRAHGRLLVPVDDRTVDLMRALRSLSYYLPFLHLIELQLQRHPA
jgi:hypothetical protein